MKKAYLIIICLVLGGIISVAYLMDQKDNHSTVTINNKTFDVELARTNAEREKGLMNRDHLDADSGMLFIFKKAEIQTFWMKNTLIPLDIIFIDNPSTSLRTGKIVEITTLDPDSSDYTPQYTPKEKAGFVLELNAGAINENGFKVGDQVKINY